MAKASKPVVGVIGNSTVINDRHNVQVVGQRNMRAVAEVAGARIGPAAKTIAGRHDRVKKRPV